MFDIPNIDLPLYLFLMMYGVYLLLYLLQSFFNIYHLIRYGVYGFGLYLIVVVFTGGTILLLGGSLLLLLPYDWTLPISLNDATSFFNEDLFPGL